MATAKRISIIHLPRESRPVPSHGIGVACISPELPDDTIIEWTSVTSATARHLARILLEAADELDAELGIELATALVGPGEN